MPLIIWDESCKTNIKEIDDEHKQIIDFINELHLSMIRGRSKEISVSTIKKLIVFAEAHFKDEETLFKKYNFPNTKNHIKKHNELSQKVEELIKKSKSYGSFLSIELFNFLKYWLEDHLKNWDMEYVEYFKSKGYI